MISVFNLGIQFHNKFIFRHLFLEVKAGQSVVLMGPSGSGKSILLKMIANLLAPTEGKIQVRNQNIGMLFQKNALFDSLSVEENLLFPLRENRGIKGAKAKKKVDQFLDAVGLKGSENLYPDEISGGMQKRLGIARALIVEPDVILYDEPTAGLDPITSKSIAILIQTLRLQMKSTLVTVTNDVQRAYQIGDQVYLLAQGKLVLGGTAQEVKSTQIPEIRQFIYGLKNGPLTPEFV